MTVINGELVCYVVSFLSFFLFRNSTLLSKPSDTTPYQTKKKKVALMPTQNAFKQTKKKKKRSASFFYTSKHPLHFCHKRIIEHLDRGNSNSFSIRTEINKKNKRVLTRMHPCWKKSISLVNRKYVHSCAVFVKRSP